MTLGRPMLLAAEVAPGAVIPSGLPVTTLQFTEAFLNTWNVTVVPPNSGSSSQYTVPLAGWYLAEGNVSQNATDQQAKYSMGFTAVANGAGPNHTDGAAVPTITAGTTPDGVGGAGAELYELNPETGDYVSWYCFQNSGASAGLQAARGMIQWIGLPTGGLTGYSGPYGTVVASPVFAALPPPGPGTTITTSGGIAAGATSMTVGSATGMVTGGTLGLDYISSQYYQPYAETVTITSVAGTTIGISPAAFAHLQGAPVAVPVSAAYLNQQVRDCVNFLAYPPMCRAVPTTTQSVPSQTFPSGTQITSLSATASGCTDNFSGFGSNVYTAPVAGLYYCYGQVYFAGSTASSSWAAGLAVNAGTIQWGTRIRSDTSSGAQSFCVTVRRHLRLTAGQTVGLYGYQNSGASVATVNSGSTFSRLIVFWRAE